MRPATRIATPGEHGLAPPTLHPTSGTGEPDKSGAPSSVARLLAPLLEVAVGGELPVRFEFWDRSTLGPRSAPEVVGVHSPDAIRRLLWAPLELGLARAFVAGDVTVQGDLVEVLGAVRAASHRTRGLDPRLVLGVLRAARAVGAVGLPLPPPPEEAAPRGLRHSRHRDAVAVRHHYDISNAFYQLVLGPSLTYSCARFTDDSMGLDAAQQAKHDLICRKLGLDERPGMRLLDVGCGWGSMALHAATSYGAQVVGITLSDAQVQLARERVARAGVQGQVEIRRQDYRELTGEQFDAISSIGMFEHVGKSKIATYFQSLHQLLTPTGRLLNHAISSVGGSRLASRTFVGRYVFPDGELIDVGEVALAMEQAGFEVRDVESLREHYARTLRAWVANLESHWDDAVDEVGIRRSRAWLLYMAASAIGFAEGDIAVHQVLGVRPGADGQSGMPPTRRGWE
ncbi:MAG TPA: cyclopropane-fatty-acyl-phospholipid synthase family protein [Acidimicrobiales bacterium]|jgi:cyclopropane-fatty-acyl-phospholipid synthase